VILASSQDFHTFDDGARWEMRIAEYGMRGDGENRRALQGRRGEELRALGRHLMRARGTAEVVA
jgi:hypothetical protein